MASSIQLSVVIPTYQRRALISSALQALAQQTLAPDSYEVIVSINGPDDGTRHVVAEFNAKRAPYPLHSIWRSEAGRAAACNAGIRAAVGEVIVLLDDDMEPAPGLLAGHWQAHLNGSSFAVIGAAPMVIEPDSSPLAIYLGKNFDHRLEKFAQPGYAIKFREAYSGNFSVRRDLMLSVGAFDEDFKLYGYEDYELALRLSKAGVQLIYSAQALAYQRYTKDFAAFARDSISRGRMAVLFVRKHPEVFHDMKLSTYTHVSKKWRLLRAVLLGLSRCWADTPQVVTALIQRLEHRRTTQLHLYYSLAIDYYYWLGVRMALREHGLNFSALQQHSL
jgi:GT2 family glycosyltransferase